MKKKNQLNSVDSKKNNTLRSKSKKNETTGPNVLNPLRLSSKKNNLRYSSIKNSQNENNNSSIKNSSSKNVSSKQVKNTSSSSHLVITSIDVNYGKLIEEDQKKIDELKEKIVQQKKMKEDNLKEINEIKESNEDMKNKIYQRNKELEKIKAEKQNIKNLNVEITNKINVITQTIEEHRQRQQNALRRREMMMNYFMSMVMGLRRRREEAYPNVDNMSYEELLALEERMGNVNKGLPKDKIEKLPKEQFSKYKFSDDKCIVCQYEFKNHEKVIVLPCKHCHHPDCITQWLENKKVCPYCKTEVKV
jgi:hypothetical protein